MTDIAAPTRNDPEAYFGRTMTAGQLIDWFARFPRETPVTVAVDPRPSNEWLNIESVSDPRVTDEFSIILGTADDFDTRQW